MKRSTEDIVPAPAQAAADDLREELARAVDEMNEARLASSAARQLRAARPSRNVLLIYDSLPDETAIYFLVDVSDEDWAWVQLCHRRYVGSGHGMPAECLEACLHLSEYLETRASLCDGPLDAAPSYRPLDLTAARPGSTDPGHRVDFVVHTGSWA